MNEYKKHIPFLIALIIVLSITYIHIADFNYLPSEYYGGDQYFHMGRTQHLYQGDAFYESSHYIDEYEHYPWLTSAIIAMGAKITGLSVLKATILFPLLAILLTAIITYNIANKITKNRYLSTLFSVICSTYYMTDSHPSEFAKFTIIPLIVFFIFFLNYKKPITLKSTILTGAIIGIAGLQHIVSFIFALCFILLIAITNYILEKKYKKEIKRLFATYVLGIIIALLYWFPLIFVYKGKTLNSWQEWTTPSVYPHFWESLSTFKSIFINFSNPLQIGVSIIMIVGIIFFILVFIKETQKVKLLEKTTMILPLLVFLAFLMGYLHPFITKPLLNMSLGHYRFPIILVFTRYLFFFVISLFLINKYKPKFVDNKVKIIALFSICLILLGVQFYYGINAEYYDHKIGFASSENILLDTYVDFHNYSLEKFPEIYKDSPVISLDLNQLFLLNGFTGAKVFATARTHANPFVDHNKRVAELAVILYGNNENERVRLLQEHNIQYFFAEESSLKTLGGCRMHYFDYDLKKERPKLPQYEAAVFCMKTTVEYGSYLRENGVDFVKDSVRLSPDKNAPSHEMLVIKPAEIKLKRAGKYVIYAESEGITEPQPFFFFAKIISPDNG